MRATRPDRLYLKRLLLGLLANTNLFAFVLSGALAFEYLRRPCLLERGRGCPRPREGVPDPPAIIYAALAGARGRYHVAEPRYQLAHNRRAARACVEPDQLLTMFAGNVASLRSDPSAELLERRARRDS